MREKISPGAKVVNMARVISPMLTFFSQQSTWKVLIELDTFTTHCSVGRENKWGECTIFNLRTPFVVLSFLFFFVGFVDSILPTPLVSFSPGV